MRRIILLAFIAFSAAMTSAAGRDFLGEAAMAFARGEYEKAGELYRAAYVMQDSDCSDKIKLCAECADFQKQARNNVRLADRDKAAYWFEKLLACSPGDTEATAFLKGYTPTQNKINYEYSAQNIMVIPVDDGRTLLYFADPALEEMTYPEALQFCMRLNAGGHTGWRLPSMDELMLYFGDFPADKGTFRWVGPKGVIINGRQMDEVERSGNSRYCPCIDGYTLKVHPYKVNSRGEVVDGPLVKHALIAVKTR